MRKAGQTLADGRFVRFAKGHAFKPYRQPLSNPVFSSEADCETIRIVEKRGVGISGKGWFAAPIGSRQSQHSCRADTPPSSRRGRLVSKLAQPYVSTWCSESRSKA